MTYSFHKDISTFLKLAELTFFPSFCQICSSLLEFPHEKIVCNSCWESLKVRMAAYCLCCGRFFESSTELHLCGLCLHKIPHFSCHRSCGRYEGKLKDIILLYKYRKLHILGKGLAQFAYQTLGNEEAIWWGIDAIIPVPLHPKRKKQRGFNQAQIIARELARLKKTVVIERVLIKLKNVPPQTSLAAEERKKNVKGIYKVSKPEQIKGKIVLLVDDVFTTGSTIYECSSVLRKAGAKDVRALTIAQA